MQQYEPQPVSRTYQYRKVMKPMLERKRRARINRCLDELKELMVTALQSDGENVAKLEKADILELTVRHLQRLSKENLLHHNNNNNNQGYSRAPGDDRYSEGWASCLKEVAAYLGGGGLDREAGLRLVSHLSRPREVGVTAPQAIQQPVWRPW